MPKAYVSPVARSSNRTVVTAAKLSTKAGIMATDEDQLVVTGLGMVSGLGLDVETSCAAARAGFSGAAQLSFTLINPLTNDPEPVIGHQVPFTVGFEGFGRLLRL